MREVRGALQLRFAQSRSHRTSSSTLRHSTTTTTTTTRHFGFLHRFQQHGHSGLARISAVRLRPDNEHTSDWRPGFPLGIVPAAQGRHAFGCNLPRPRCMIHRIHPVLTDGTPETFCCNRRVPGKTSDVFPFCWACSCRIASMSLPCLPLRRSACLIVCCFHPMAIPQPLSDQLGALSLSLTRSEQQRPASS